MTSTRMFHLTCTDIWQALTSSLLYCSPPPTPILHILSRPFHSLSHPSGWYPYILTVAVLLVFPIVLSCTCCVGSCSPYLLTCPCRCSLIVYVYDGIIGRCYSRVASVLYYGLQEALYTISHAPKKCMQQCFVQCAACVIVVCLNDVTLFLHLQMQVNLQHSDASTGWHQQHHRVEHA